MSISLEDWPLRTPIPIFIYTSRGTWLEGVAQQHTLEAHTLHIEVPGGIEDGTSGSLILTTTGALVGIVSNANETFEGAQACLFAAPRPHLTLPAWVVRRIQAASTA